jgi:hypothetical protein
MSNRYDHGRLRNTEPPTRRYCHHREGMPMASDMFLASFRARKVKNKIVYNPEAIYGEDIAVYNRTLPTVYIRQIIESLWTSTVCSIPYAILYVCVGVQIRAYGTDIPTKHSPQ